MNVCFCAEGQLKPQIAAELSSLMAAAVRAAMPARIFQHTDPFFPAMPCADVVFRKMVHGDHIERRWTYMHEQMQSYPENTLSLDYDIIVRRDVRYVFDLDFDVAMCRTPDRSDKAYNAGVIFVKPSGASFWQEVLRAYRTKTGRDDWEDSQRALTIAADATNLKVLDLSFEKYNFTPDRPGIVPTEADIVHYRGRRKSFMAEDNRGIACSLS